MHRHPELAISLMRALEGERLAEARARRRRHRRTRSGDAVIDASAAVRAPRLSAEPRATEATGLDTARAQHG